MAVVTPRIRRRVDERFQRYRLEIDPASAARGDRQRASIVPALGQHEARFDEILRVVDVLLVQNVAIPITDHDIARRELAVDEIVRRVEQDREIHNHMKGVQVDRIAFPGNRLTAGADLEFGDVVQRPRGSMFARNPLGIHERKGAGLDGNRHVRVGEAARSGALVEEDRHRARTRRKRPIELGSRPGVRHPCGGAETSRGESAAGHCLTVIC